VQDPARSASPTLILIHVFLLQEVVEYELSHSLGGNGRMMQSQHGGATCKEDEVATRR
jgi:hypothetical protein